MLQCLTAGNNYFALFLLTLGRGKAYMLIVEQQQLHLGRLDHRDLGCPSFCWATASVRQSSQDSLCATYRLAPLLTPCYLNDACTAAIACSNTTVAQHSVTGNLEDRCSSCQAQTTRNISIVFRTMLQCCCALLIQWNWV